LGQPGAGAHRGALGGRSRLLEPPVARPTLSGVELTRSAVARPPHDALPSGCELRLLRRRALGRWSSKTAGERALWSATQERSALPDEKLGPSNCLLLGHGEVGAQRDRASEREGPNHPLTLCAPTVAIEAFLLLVWMGWGASPCNHKPAEVHGPNH
jgi:hypothetical protein